jgi:hypothetical protein
MSAVDCSWTPIAPKLLAASVIETRHGVVDVAFTVNGHAVV